MSIEIIMRHCTAAKAVFLCDEIQSVLSGAKQKIGFITYKIAGEIRVFYIIARLIFGGNYVYTVVIKIDGRSGLLCKHDEFIPTVFVAVKPAQEQRSAVCRHE